MEGNKRPMRGLVMVLWLALLLLGAVGCSNGSSSDASSDSGTRTLNYGEYPYTQKISNLGSVRLTDSGVAYLAAHIPDIIQYELSHANLSIPAYNLPLNICALCPNGCPLNIPIKQVKLNLVAPNTMKVIVVLPSDFAVNLDSSCAGCNIYANTGGVSLQIAMDITFNIVGDDNADNKKLDIVVGDPTVDLDNIHVGLDGGLCILANLGLNQFVDAIKSVLKGVITNAVSSALGTAVDGFKCISCSDTKPCLDPDNEGVTCKSNVCRRPDGSCELTTLGVEMEVDLGKMLEKTIPGLDAKVWASYAAGGRAQVNDDGLDMGLFGSSMMAPGSGSNCVDDVSYPTDPLPNVPLGNTNPHQSNATYHLGIGMREELLDQIGYTLQNSGLLCSSINVSSLSSMATFSALTLVASSIDKVAHGATAPLMVKLEPGPIPLDFAIVDPGTDFAGHPEVQTGLSIRITDLNLHLLALVDDRWVRALTLQVNLAITAGVAVTTDSTTGQTQIQIVFGLSNIKFSNWRVPFSLAGETPESIADTAGNTLVNTILGMGISIPTIAPISIPSVDITGDGNPDLTITIQNIAGEQPKSSTSPTEYQALAVYAKLTLNTLSTRNAVTKPAATFAHLGALHLATPAERKVGQSSWVRLGLNGRNAEGTDDNLEFQYAIDNGAYSMWSSERNPVVKADALSADGVHTILVRARDNRHPTSVDPNPVALTVTTDTTPPTLNVMRKEDRVYFQGSDTVSKANELSYRYRLNDGSWTAWSNDNSVAVEKLGHLPVRLTVNVMDQKGFITSETRLIEKTHARSYVIASSAVAGHASVAETKAAAGSTGCQSTTAGASGLLLLAATGLLAMWRRRRQTATWMAVLVLGSLLALGCSSKSESGCKVNADCSAGEQCISGTCMPPVDGDTNIGTPDGDSEANVEGEKDSESEGDLTCPNGKNEECPECYYCKAAKKICVPQKCDPNCPADKAAELHDADSSVLVDCTATDTCSSCVLPTANVPIYNCVVPRCTADSDCGCRSCDAPSTAYCDKDAGACRCQSPCDGGCPTGKSICCLSDNQCKACKHWCEGATCPAGYQAGTCNPETETDPLKCSWAAQWSYCSDSLFAQSTCTYSAVGTPDHPSCACTELPALPIGTYGISSDVAVHNDDLVWMVNYNSTYGDLMLGQVHVSDLAISDNSARQNHVTWQFLDGVPDEAPTAGPSGPRGGVATSGPNVGMYSSIALSSTGWPRVAYQDVKDGKLLFIYTDGETAPEESDTSDVSDSSDSDSDNTSDATSEPAAVKRHKHAKDSVAKLVWTKLVLDETGVTGLYTRVWMDPQGRPVIAYMTETDQADTTQVGTSSLKLAWAKTAKPQSADDFIFVTIDQAPALLPTGNLSSIPVGTGLHPSIMAAPDGSLWVFYYHHTTYETRDNKADNYSVGLLKRARLNAKITDIDTPSADNLTFTVETFLGAAGTLVTGDVGLFSSAVPTQDGTGYAVAFFNATLNQVQFVYAIGNSGLKMGDIVDDGWRTNASGRSHQVWVGADASAQIDDQSYVRIVYQDMMTSKLMYFSEQCLDSGCGLATRKHVLMGMSDQLTAAGNAYEYGKGYGSFARQVLINGGTTSVVTHFASNLVVDPVVQRQEILIAQ